MNLIKRPSKWPNLQKNTGSYFQHFSMALLNFEQNKIEEKVQPGAIALMIKKK